MSSKCLIITKEALNLCFIHNVPAEVAKPEYVVEFLTKNHFINPESSFPAEYWVIPLPELEGDDEFDPGDYIEHYEFCEQNGKPSVYFRL